MMAKLYWRVKRNGKWTWRPVKCTGHDFVMANCSCDECTQYMEEEE